MNHSVGSYIAVTCKLHEYVASVITFLKMFSKRSLMLSHKQHAYRVGQYCDIYDVKVSQ